VHGCVHWAHVIASAVRSTRVDKCVYNCVSARDWGYSAINARGCLRARVRVCERAYVCGLWRACVAACACVRSFDGVNERASCSCVAWYARANRIATLMHSSARRDKKKLTSAQAPHSPRLPLLLHPSPPPAAHHHHSTTITTFRRGSTKEDMPSKRKASKSLMWLMWGVWGVWGESL
jgi:hypothetical protein